MEKHITQQLIKLQQTGDKLTKKLHHRIAREKVIKFSIPTTQCIKVNSNILYPLLNVLKLIVIYYTHYLMY